MRDRRGRSCRRRGSRGLRRRSHDNGRCRCRRRRQVADGDVAGDRHAGIGRHGRRTSRDRRRGDRRRSRFTVAALRQTRAAAEDALRKSGIVAPKQDASRVVHRQGKAPGARVARLKNKGAVGPARRQLAVDAGRLGAGAGGLGVHGLEDVVVALGGGEVARVDLRRDGGGCRREEGEGGRDGEVGRSGGLDGDGGGGCRRA